MNKKIKSQTGLIKEIGRLRGKKKKIVTINGSFDLLHVGHARLLQHARSKGDVLVVLLNSDKSIKLYKGPDRPVVREADRAGLISALECVDLVALFDEINPKRILDMIKPDIHCNGSDWGKNCVEREIVERNGGRIDIMKKIPGHSTTDLLKDIARVNAKPAVKAVFLDRDGTINIKHNYYTYRIEDFEYAPFAIEAMKVFSKLGYKLMIVTNQSGIGRGCYTFKQFHKLNSWMLNDLRKKGIKIDKVYFCPHKPEDRCQCRKPGIGMLLEAVKDFGVSLNDSWMVGDDERDIIMGREANVKTIKLDGKMKGGKLQPNHYADDLWEAAKIISHNA